MNGLTGECRPSANLARPARALLIASAVFGLVLCGIDAFAAAYVMRSSNDVSTVIMFQLAVCTGAPCSFLMNSVLLRRFAPARLSIAGMLLTGVAVVAATAPGSIALSGLIAAGFLLGAATGLFAANRLLLALSPAGDKTREACCRLEMFASVAAWVVVPLVAGALIETTAARGWLGGTRQSGYRIAAACACGLAALSSLILLPAWSPSAPRASFLYFRFHPLWRKMTWLAVLRGLAQGYAATMPAMLVMRLAGQEGMLGALLALGGIASGFALLALAGPPPTRPRLGRFAGGLLLFALGALANALLFNAAGVAVFVICLFLGKPLLDVNYSRIQTLVIDALSEVEWRNQFAYFLNHEFGLYAGRLLGCALFLALAARVSGVVALRFSMPAIAAVQLLSVQIARRTVHEARAIAARTQTEQAANEIAAS